MRGGAAGRADEYIGIARRSGDGEQVCMDVAKLLRFEMDGRGRGMALLPRLMADVQMLYS